MRFEPRQWLETVLPALLRSSTIAPPKPTTVIQLVISDRDDLDWVYEISRDAVNSRQGVSDDVDLTLSFFSKDIAALSANELDVARAVRASRIKVMGNQDVLRWFAQRLEVES